jgi:hypothetical protein
VINTTTKYLNAKFKEHKYFVDEVETLYQQIEKPLWAAKPKKFTIQNIKLITRQ